MKKYCHTTLLVPGDPAFGTLRDFTTSEGLPPGAMNFAGEDTRVAFRPDPVFVARTQILRNAAQANRQLTDYPSNLQAQELYYTLSLMADKQAVDSSLTPQYAIHQAIADYLKQWRLNLLAWYNGIRTATTPNYYSVGMIIDDLEQLLAAYGVRVHTQV
jgi:hypothetical protein